MNILIVGCGWVGTYLATEMLSSGHRIWATCTSAQKAQQLETRGLVAAVANFDHDEVFPELGLTTFDVAIISVPVKRKDSAKTVHGRFTKLIAFLEGLSFKQLFFFSSVGIYPKVSATITESTFADTELAPTLLFGENALRTAFPKLNILRLGGLFGLDRIMAKYFVGQVCQIGYQTANCVHVSDIYGVVKAMIVAGLHAKTYNVVCPEHPLKKDVITASATKYGYGMPVAFSEADKTAKVVSPARLINDLDYRFTYRSPLQF